MDGFLDAEAQFLDEGVDVEGVAVDVDEGEEDFLILSTVADQDWYDLESSH